MIRELIYENPLQSESDVDGFILEGSAKVSFEEGRMRLSSVLDPALGQAANYVYWCPVDFPSDVEICWDYYPLNNIGLCILFFSAMGQDGQDIFDPSLKKRAGKYETYHSSDINAYHVSYFRRRHPSERAFRTCNLRKSHGFNLVALGGDPLPYVEDAVSPYHIRIRKWQGTISFYINDLLILKYEDDGKTYGKILGGGKIGFRQMSPMVAEYENFQVYELSEDNVNN